ncbi:hypothetical protein JCM6882_002496 [Rhodosporidiobolus microsporus]
MDSNQLLQTLQGTLAADPNTRIQAELSLAQALRSPQTAVGLAKLATEQQVEVPWRQAASFALKKYVKEFWSPFFASFKGPEATSPEAKAQIREVLFTGLADPVRKIRLACANIVSLIAQPDWPEDWPTLMDQLLALVRSSSIDAVEGGMRALSDFVSVSLTEDQLLPVARDMLPTLLAILGAPQMYGPSTRARAILIFRQCVMTLFTVKDEHPEAVKSAVGEILPVWLDAFNQLLQVDAAADLTGANAENWDNVAVRTAIFSSLEVILNSFPSTLKSSLPQFLAHSAAHLNSLLPIYTAAYLSNSSDFSIPSSSGGEEDSDISTDLPSLVSTVLDFVAQGARRKAVKGLFVEGGKPSAGLVEFLVRGIELAQMTTDDEDSWASDPNAFVADEDDEMASYNVRAAALDMSIAFIETFSDTALLALQSAFSSVASSSEQQRAQSSEDWWKGYESALAVVGGVSEDLIEHVQERAEEGKPPKFALEQVFEGVVVTYLTASNLPFLQGRAFVFASQFAEVLPQQLAKQYIQAAIQVLDAAEAGVPVKVSAVRALTNFFRHLKENVEPSHAAVTLSKLLPLLPQTTENTLVLVLDAIQSSLKTAGTIIDASTASALIKAVLTTWFEKPEDPLLGSSIADIFAALSASPAPVVQTALHTEALPALVHAMSQVSVDYASSIRAAAALDIANAIFSRLPTPLPAGVFATVAPSLFEMLAGTEDRDVIQTSLDIVTTVIRKDVDQLLNWRSPTGQSGLELVLAQVAKLLQPSESEAGGLFVGDLVIHLVRKAGGAIGPVLPDLLQAFVTRLATAQTAMFSQSLILPFAYLIHQQLDTVVSLLEGLTVSGATGEAPRQALEVLLTAWCESAPDFQGYWNQKVSSVALSQLYAAAASRPSLQQVQVKGDLLITDANKNKIMTRARAKANPDQFSVIPFPAKALKLLLSDAQNAAKQQGANDGGVPDDAVSDDEDDEWADEGAEFTSGNERDLDFLSDMLAGGGLSKYMNSGSDDGEDDLDEQDLQDDPIWQLDLSAHLASFFRQAYESDLVSFRQLVEQFLSDEDKGVLTHLLQSA